jgi:hypothetical protein
MPLRFESKRKTEQKEEKELKKHNEIASWWQSRKSPSQKQKQSQMARLCSTVPA